MSPPPNHIQSGLNSKILLERMIGIFSFIPNGQTPLCSKPVSVLASSTSKKKWSQEQKKEKNQNGIEGYDFLKRMRENCFQSKSSFDED